MLRQLALLAVAASLSLTRPAAACSGSKPHTQSLERTRIERVRERLKEVKGEFDMPSNPYKRPDHEQLSEEEKDRLNAEAKREWAAYKAQNVYRFDHGMMCGSSLPCGYHVTGGSTYIINPRQGEKGELMIDNGVYHYLTEHGQVETPLLERLEQVLELL